MGSRLLALLASLLVALVALALPLAAHASDGVTETPSSSPTPSGAASPGASPSAAPVDPNVTAINVVLRDESNLDDEGNPTPVPSVTLTVTDDGGGDVGEGVTDAQGRAIIAVPAKGTYTVSLDESTLPEGVELDSGARTEIEIAVRLDGPNNFGVFPIGVVSADTASFGDKFGDALVSGVKFGLIVGLAALGLSLIFGATGLSNFAHGELITLGGLLTYVFNQGLGLSVILAGVVATILSGVFGYGQDRLLWRPLRHRGTGVIAMMIVSIGFGLFLRSIYQYLFGGSTRSLSQYTNQERRDFGPVSLADKEIAIILVAVVVIAVTCVAMMRARLGKAMRAVSDNPALSASSGMRVDGVISAAWVLGTALTGLAGVLYAVNSQVNFQMGFKLLLLVFAAVTLGGFGTIWGALFGSMVIGIVVEMGPLFGVPSSIKEVGALVILILILLVRPQGILGRRERIG
ncbi:branched-chain amino acid ABC transporter permease [Nocardioides pantholopis]|uniref:branched-chain amino acid ABC transporter permease n=1 Tax=Nocardioides pantholopis TaxID=2483798 RepID=UPI0013DDE740|nr:branched-chain amino acid ABC transporter permease [Nocardioides pantholopis]